MILLKRNRCSLLHFEAVIADKGYDSDPLRALLEAKQVWSSLLAAIASNHGTMTD